MDKASHTTLAASDILMLVVALSALWLASRPPTAAPPAAKPQPPPPPPPPQPQAPVQAAQPDKVELTAEQRRAKLSQNPVWVELVQRLTGAMDAVGVARNDADRLIGLQQILTPESAVSWQSTSGPTLTKLLSAVLEVLDAALPPNEVDWSGVSRPVPRWNSFASLVKQKGRWLVQLRPGQTGQRSILSPI